MLFEKLVFSINVWKLVDMKQELLRTVLLKKLEKFIYSKEYSNFNNDEYMNMLSENVVSFKII